MTATPEYDRFLEEAARHHAGREAAFARNKTALFAAMAEAGLTLVEVEFDGAGDSGAIEGVRAFAAGDAEAVVPAIPVTLSPAAYDPDEAERSLNLAEAVQEVAWDALALRCGGWENNEGGWGTVRFDAPAEAVTLDLHERVIESVHSFFAL